MNPNASRGRRIARGAGPNGKRRIQRFGRSTWLFVVAVLVLGLTPFVALATVSTTVATAAARDEAERAVAGAASASAVAVSEQMRGLSDVVESYATRNAVRVAMSRPVDMPALHRTLEELFALRTDITLTFVTDAQGVLGSVIPETPSIVGQSFAFRDWYRGSVENRAVYVSEAYQTAASGHAIVVAAAAPVYDADDPTRLAGIIVAGYDLGAIQMFVDEYSSAQGVSITMTDQRGTIIAKTGEQPTSLVSLADDPRVTAALRGESGNGVSDRSGSSRVYAFAPVPTVGWTVTAEVSADAAYASARTVRSNIGIATALICVIVAVGLAFVLVQQLRRARADAELRHTSALLSAIVDNNPHAITVSDADLAFVRVNRAGEELLGIESDQLVGRTPDELKDRLPSGFLWDDDAEVLASGTVAESPTKTITLQNGQERVIRTIKVPIASDGDAAVRVLLRISEDVTESVEAERAVRAAQQAAEDANRAKSEFLSRMSHELRTPLNAVIGFAQLLEQDGLSPDQQDSARHIRHGGQHLLDLINEILDISLIETGRLRVSLEPVRLGDVIDESLSLVGSLARQRSIHMPTSHRPACEMHVRGDRQRLKQVLLNLLTNAVKYNRDDGTVTVTCSPTAGGRVRVAVTDSGPGIPQDKLDLVFMPFERLGAESSGVEGTGLGLTLSRGLVAAMGGEMGVSSEIGRGTTFWVELDRVTAPADVVPVDIMPNPHGSSSSAPPKPKTVLYIEDNMSNVKLVERILASTPQYTLFSAMHGERGIDLAKERMPDLVLLDLNLPDMGGDEILARLRAEPTTRNIPVIVVSADATSQQIHRLVAAGVAGYLTKPINVNEFRRVLEMHLEASEPREEADAPLDGRPLSDAGAVQAPVVPPPLTEGVLEEVAVRNLAELLTDDGDIADFLSTFDREVSSRLQALKEAIAAGDWNAMRSLTHALRGSLGTIGAATASSLCASIETLANPSSGALGEAVEQLGRSIKRAQSEIHARLLKPR